MRYLMSWHIHESELHERSPEWREEVTAFLAEFEGDLLTSSELEWVEVLGPESQAVVVGPGAVIRDGVYNLDGKPAARVWAVRVSNKDRAVELAATLAGELDTWVEVRECMPGSQRP